MSDPNAPRPRRTRRGEVVIGPTLLARYAPGALVGLPLVSLLLCPLTASALVTWARGGRDGTARAAASDLLAHEPLALVIGFVLTWALLALWALLPMALTSRTVRFDPERRVLTRRRGLGRRESVGLEAVVYAVGEPERASVGLIGIGDDAERPPWVIPAIGWDDASFDGLRVLQEAAGLRPAPPRAELAGIARRARQAAAHREMAERIAMPWRAQYEQDPAAFRRDFDHARRVLGGKESGTEKEPPAR